jgi:hypothetical protein
MTLRIAIAAILLQSIIFPTMASKECMTRPEASAYYKTSFLYWRTEDHCWGDRSSGSMPTRQKSAPASVGSLPSGESDAPVMAHAAGADTVSIWPSVPAYSFTDRWPNQTVCLPDRWLHELEQFGTKEILK